MSETTSPGTSEIAASLVTLHQELAAFTRAQQDGIFADRPMQDATVTPLSAGHHNINALVTVGDFTCVARTRPNKMGESCNPIEAEYAKLSVLGGQFCPTPFHLSQMPCQAGGTTPVLYMEHIPGETRDMSDLSPKQTKHIAQMLSQLHSTPIEHLAALDLEAPNSLEEYIEQTIQRCVLDKLAEIDTTDPLYGRALGHITTLLGLLQQELTRHQAAFVQNKLSPLHRDVSKGNVLWLPDDSCKLIDWEGLCLGDPADDASYFLIDNRVKPSGWQEFMHHYMPPTGDHTFYQRLKAYHLKNWADDMTWALTGYDRERKGQEVICADRPGLFKGYFEDRLTRLGAFLGNLRYNEA